MLEEAINFSMEAHKGQTSKDGSPYFYHPISVAAMVATFFSNDEHLQVVALLHDVVEDTPITLLDLTLEFNREVALVVELLTRNKSISYKDYINNLAPLPELMEDKHYAAAAVKLCDLIVNIRRASSLQSLDEELGLRNRWQKALILLQEYWKSRLPLMFSLEISNTLQHNINIIKELSQKGNKL